MPTPAAAGERIRGKEVQGFPPHLVFYSLGSRPDTFRSSFGHPFSRQHPGPPSAALAMALVFQWLQKAALGSRLPLNRSQCPEQHFDHRRKQR